MEDGAVHERLICDEETEEATKLVGAGGALADVALGSNRNVMLTPFTDVTSVPLSKIFVPASVVDIPVVVVLFGSGSPSGLLLDALIFVCVTFVETVVLVMVVLADSVVVSWAFTARRLVGTSNTARIKSANNFRFLLCSNFKYNSYLICCHI